MNANDGFITPYETALKSKYTMSKNSQYEDKIINKYRGFNSIIEVEDFIKSIANMKQKVYYEIIKNNGSKFYFDIDKVELTHKEFDEYLNDFIIAFNIYFKLKITIDDLLIYYRDDKKNIDIITSSHIIIKGYNSTKKIMKLFLSYFNKNIDEKIYTCNRLFNLPFNTKLKYIIKYKDYDYTNQKLFIDYKTQNANIKDYLVSYIENTQKVIIPFYHLLVSFFKRLDKLEIKQSHKLLKEGFNAFKNNANKEIIEPIKVYYNKLDDCLHFLMENLPNAFFDNSNDWKTMTNIFKKFNMSFANILLWNEMGSIKSNNKWTIEKNNDYYSNIDINKVKSGLPIFKKIVKKYINYEILIETNRDLLKWIETKTNNNYDDVIRNNANNQIITLTNNDDIFYYDTKSGFLKNKNKIIIGNFNIEVELKKVYDANKNIDEIELNHINDIDPYLLAFNNSLDGIFAVNAKWGTGKTHKVIRSVINDARYKNKRVIMLTENNALNLKFANDFEFITHINNKNIDQSKNIACSTESIQKININVDDVIILDEYETLLNHYSSETFKKKEFNKFLLFKQALQKAKKIIVLDADLSLDRLTFLKNLKGISYKTYYINQNNFNDYSFLVYENKDTFFKCIDKSFNTNKKVIIASSSKNQNDILYIDIKNKIANVKIKPKTILKANSDGVFLYRKNKEELVLDKHETLNKLEDAIITNNVDIFLFTPTIKTGISINSTYFNVCYGYAHNKSVCSREFLQMLFRARNLKDKEIHISFNTSFRPITNYVLKEQIKNYILSPITIFKSFKLFGEDNDFKEVDIQIDTDIDYLNMKITNLYESYNSQTRFTQDIMTRLIYNHNLPIKFISLYDDDDDKNEKDDTELIITDDKMVNTKLITHDEYIKKQTYETMEKIQKLQEKRNLLEYEYKTDIQDKTETYYNCVKSYLDQYNDEIKELTEHGINWREYEKYNLFYRFYYFKGITDNYNPNKDLYDFLNTSHFYHTYNDKETKEQMKLLKRILNQTPQTILENNSEYANSNSVNSLNNYEHKIGKQRIIIDVINHLSLDLTKLPQTKTNKEYDSIIMNFNLNQFNKSLENYFKNYEIEHFYKFDFKDKNYKKNIKKVLHDLLAEIGVYVKYTSDKNTTRDNDKMVFYYKDFNTEKSLYKGRLNGLHIRTDKAVKTRNIYKTENGIKLYKSNEKYYTTYEVKYNKNIKYLMTQKTDETLYKDLMENTLNKDLKIYLKMKNRPYVIDNKTYYEYV